MSALFATDVVETHFKTETQLCQTYFVHYVRDSSSAANDMHSALHTGTCGMAQEYDEFMLNISACLAGKELRSSSPASKRKSCHHSAPGTGAGRAAFGLLPQSFELSQVSLEAKNCFTFFDFKRVSNSLPLECLSGLDARLSGLDARSASTGSTLRILEQLETPAWKLHGMTWPDVSEAQRLNPKSLQTPVDLTQSSATISSKPKPSASSNTQNAHMPARAITHQPQQKIATAENFVCTTELSSTSPNAHKPAKKQEVSCSSHSSSLQQQRTSFAQQSNQSTATAELSCPDPIIFVVSV